VMLFMMTEIPIDDDKIDKFMALGILATLGNEAKFEEFMKGDQAFWQEFDEALRAGVLEFLFDSQHELPKVRTKILKTPPLKHNK
jgi:hypothetical protein